MTVLVIILSVVSIIAAIFLIDNERLRKQIELLEKESKRLNDPTTRRIAVIPHEYKVDTISAEVLIDNKDLTNPDIYEFISIEVANKLADALKDYIKYEEIRTYNPAFGEQRIMYAELKVLKPEEKPND